MLGFIVSYCITIIFFLKNDIISTFNVFFWMIIEFFILYAFFDRDSIKSIFEDVRKINVPVSVIALISAVIGIVSILLRITVAMDDPEGLNRMWAFGMYGERNSGHFNNPIPFASCLYIGIIASLWNFVSNLFDKEKKHSKLSYVFYAATFVLSYFAMQTTFTRSFVYAAYVAFGAAGFIAGYYFFKDNPKLIIRILAALLCLVIVVGGAYLLAKVEKVLIPYIANLSDPRVFLLGETVEGKGKDEIITSLGIQAAVPSDRTQFGASFLGPRENIWRVALDVIPHSPVLGFTSGNREATSLMYDTTGYCEQSFKTGIPTYHNSYIDIAVSAGLLGLAIMLLFLAFNVFKSFKVIFSKNTRLDKHQSVFYGLLVGGCAAHIGMTSMFLGTLVFNNISCCLYFWVLLGALSACNELLDRENKKLKISLITDKIFKRKTTAE